MSFGKSVIHNRDNNVVQNMLSIISSAINDVKRQDTF